MEVHGESSTSHYPTNPDTPLLNNHKTPMSSSFNSSPKNLDSDTSMREASSTQSQHQNHSKSPPNGTHPHHTNGERQAAASHSPTNTQHITSMDVDDDEDDDVESLALNPQQHRGSEHSKQNDDATSTRAKTNTNSTASTKQKQCETFDVQITEEDYEAIAIMIDELMNDDPAVRIKAIRSLPVISSALGKERTRNELIPYVTQMIDDDDEVLLVLIEEIYRLLSLRMIGGDTAINNQYSYCMIPPFERLCQVEEKIIRDEACSKFGRILHDMPYNTHTHYVDEYTLPLLRRLCQSDWHTARISGATLIANVFERFAQEEEAADTFTRYKQDMLTLVSELCTDRIPIVRRSVMITLGKMVSVLSARDVDDVITHYLPLFQKLANDDQDNVRVFAVETLIQFGRIMSQKQVVEHLLYHMRLLAVDQAWRVRYIAADKLIDMCGLLDTATIQSSMIDYYIRLLADQEPEVRAVAIHNMPGMATLVGSELSIKKLIPIISKELVCDANKYARASLASVIIPFCYLLPHQVVMDDMLACILKILKDEYPNVRLHAISNICMEQTHSSSDVTIDKQFDISLLEQSIIPSIMELTLDADWRVRLGMIEKFPPLAKRFGLKFFNERLFDLCLSALEDNVADIRLSAASNLYEIVTVFDENQFAWSKEKLIPRLVERIHASKHYLHRVIYLVTFKYLAEGLGEKENDEVIRHIAHFMCNDTVPNVRFKACQIVMFLANNGLMSTAAVEQVKPKLEQLTRCDQDIDVKYFAKRALETIH